MGILALKVSYLLIFVVAGALGVICGVFKTECSCPEGQGKEERRVCNSSVNLICVVIKKNIGLLSLSLSLSKIMCLQFLNRRICSKSNREGITVCITLNYILFPFIPLYYPFFCTQATTLKQLILIPILWIRLTF